MYHVVHLRTYNMKILRKGSSHELQEHWIGRIILPPLLNLIEWEALDWLQWWYVVHKDNRFRIIRSSFGIPWNCKEVWLDQYPTQYKSVELYIIVEVEIPTNRSLHKVKQMSYIIHISKLAWMLGRVTRECKFSKIIMWWNE